jgi:hypothetical protein
VSALYTVPMTRVVEAAEAYQPWKSSRHVGAVAVYVTDTIWLPAVPLGVSAMYPVAPVARLVHVEASGVSSATKVKNAPAISTTEPAAMDAAAEVL